MFSALNLDPGRFAAGDGVNSFGNAALLLLFWNVVRHMSHESKQLGSRRFRLNGEFGTKTEGSEDVWRHGDMLRHMY
ncbi:hypothetical protein MTO96_031674 [Rhipicephalus appendiculatus]